MGANNNKMKTAKLCSAYFTVCTSLTSCLENNVADPDTVLAGSDPDQCIESKPSILIKQGRVLKERLPPKFIVNGIMYHFQI